MNNDYDYADYYTVDEFAARANISSKTVRNYIKAGRIQARRKGVKLIAIPIDEIDNLYSDYGSKRGVK